ncbi:ATP-binding protein [Salinicoccus albus]|uniref:ATP-binding protein n=1 Tax=Salinicoccus albus TaxID=418756 RepID=UPI000367AB19|nr:ATP-binding protein [Salinicoccus albus]
MDTINEMMQGYGIKHTSVEHLNIKCEECNHELKIVTITYTDGTQEEKRAGCVCEATRRANEKQKEINARTFDKGSIMHGDYREKTLDDYQAETKEQSVALRSARKYIDTFDEQMKNRRNIIFQGMFGTGKTHLAAAIRNELSKKNYKALFMSLPDYIDRVKQEFKETNQRHPIYKMAQDADLLVLDDVGANRMTDFEVSELFRLVEARTGKCTVYTTNYDSNDFISSRELHRVFSRMMSNTAVIVLNGDDYREKGLI